LGDVVDSVQANQEGALADVLIGSSYVYTCHTASEEYEEGFSENNPSGLNRWDEIEDVIFWYNGGELSKLAFIA
jgi:hypothetical protein